MRIKKTFHQPLFSAAFDIRILKRAYLVCLQWSMGTSSVVNIAYLFHHHSLRWKSIHQQIIIFCLLLLLAVPNNDAFNFRFSRWLILLHFVTVDEAWHHITCVRTTYLLFVFVFVSVSTFKNSRTKIALMLCAFAKI